MYILFRRLSYPGATSLIYLWLLLFAPSAVIAANVIVVGPGKQFLYPSVAAKFAEDGDIIEIDARGLYLNDTAVWKQDNIIIRGVNGRPHLRTKGKISNNKAIWILKGDNIRIENIEFSGARVNDRNGAGIRVEGTNLNIKKCYFHDNQNGILAGKNPDSAIVIEDSIFERNGHGKGRTHNMYIGHVGSFTLKSSYSSMANVGHNIKSRAANNFIYYNVIVDGVAGKSSYAVDLPNGGNATILGNVVQQGEFTENWVMINFGSEGLEYPNSHLNMIHNTLVNDRSSGVFVKVQEGASANLENNIFAGKGKVTKGIARVENNIMPGDDPDFIDREGFDYSLNKKSSAIDRARPVAKDLLDRQIFPGFQRVNGQLVKRVLLGNGYDIGAIESH